MSTVFNKKGHTQKTIFADQGLWLVMGICWVYWLYLLFFSRMIIIYDAEVFEVIGKVIYEKGWIEFFKGGPYREPLYPFLISLSMHIGEWLGISYHYVQKFVQIIFLFSAQLLLFKLLQEMKVGRILSLLIVLYFGFSPAVINSTMSLYSEIASYPFVLLIVWFGSRSLKAVHCESLRQVLLFGLGTSLAFMGAISVKGIFQYVFLCYLVTLFLLGVSRYFHGSLETGKRIAVYFLVVSALVFSFLHSYRMMNLKYNGNYELTDRYDVNLFGVSVKRSEPLTPRLFLAQIASTMGSGVCNKFFDEKTCKYCEFYSMEDNKSMLGDLLKDTPPGQVHHKTLSLAFERMRQRPLQYALLTFLESFKMAFWESTQIGFVLYPDWMEALYKNVLFKNTLRLVVTLLTYCALIFSFFYLIKHRRALSDFDAEKAAPLRIQCVALGVILVFTGLYSLYPILTRFAFPIVSLYFLSFGFFCQRYFVGKSQ